MFKFFHMNTTEYPQMKLYNLTSHLIRPCLSVLPNIAKCCVRNPDNEVFKFLYASLDYLAKLETHVIIAKKITYLDNIEIEDVTYVKKMVFGLSKYIK